MDMKDFISKRQEDLDVVTAWYKELYETKFAKYFTKQRKLYFQLKHSDNPISNSDLEWILTELPMNLFDVSEVLNEVRLQLEVLKMKRKEKRNNAIKYSNESNDEKRKMDADTQIIEDDLAIEVFTTLIQRVEGEISFSRELIMGAKKIWDGRRDSAASNPISPVNTEIPEYQPKPSTTGKPPAW